MNSQYTYSCSICIHKSAYMYLDGKQEITDSNQHKSSWTRLSTCLYQPGMKEFHQFLLPCTCKNRSISEVGQAQVSSSLTKHRAIPKAKAAVKYKVHSFQSNKPKRSWAEEGKQQLTTNSIEKHGTIRNQTQWWCGLHSNANFSRSQSRWYL